jgi:hypothetical protein
MLKLARVYTKSHALAENEMCDSLQGMRVFFLFNAPFNAQRETVRERSRETEPASRY